MSATAHQDLIAGVLIPCPKCHQHKDGVTLRLEPGKFGIRARLLCPVCGHQAPATKWYPERCEEMCQEACIRWHSEDNILRAHGRQFEFDVMTQEQVESAAKAYYQQRMAEAPRSTTSYAPPPKPTPWWRKIIKKLLT